MYTSYFCAILFSVFREFFTSIIPQSGHYFSFRKFFHPSFINQSIILHFANFLQSSLIDQGLLYFANVIHLSIDQGFFAFREYLTFIFSSIRPFFCISRISYLHPFIDQGLFFCTFLDLFIHFFLCASIFLHFGH